MDLLKDLSKHLTGILARDIKKLRSELINEHIQGLCTQIDRDPTLIDLQKEVELLGVRVNSLVPPTTGWDEIDTANTFPQNKLSSIIRDIKDLKHLSM